MPSHQPAALVLKRTSGSADSKRNVGLIHHPVGRPRSRSRQSRRGIEPDVAERSAAVLMGLALEMRIMGGSIVTMALCSYRGW